MKLNKVSSAELDYRVKKEIELFNTENETNFGTGMSGPIHIERTDFELKDCPASFGVNWSACGTQYPEDAQNFARQLMLASSLAEHLTMFQWVCDYTMDGSEFVEQVRTLREETGIEFPV